MQQTLWTRQIYFPESLQIMGTVSFQVKNSKIELTNGDGIRVLENYEAVATASESAYEDKPQLKAKVKEIIDHF